MNFRFKTKRQESRNQISIDMARTLEVRLYTCFFIIIWTKPRTATYIPSTEVVQDPCWNEQCHLYK